MATRPTARELADLLEARDGPCVSIFQPTHRASAETRQDPIRFKNLVGEAEEALSARGVERREAEELLAPARRLVDDRDFWQHQKEGLAFFLRRGEARHWKLPYAVPPRVTVDDYFSVRPLVPLVNHSGLFYVLALARNRIRFYAAREDHLDEIELPDVPDGMPEMLRFIESQKTAQFHTGTGPAPGGRQRAAVFHGQGPEADDPKKWVFELFRALDGAVQREVGDSRAPLVPAGEERTVTIFREACTYAHLTEDAVTGNPEHLGRDELLARAAAVVRPIFDEDRKRALQRFGEAAGTPRGTSDAARVVAAATAGLVEALLVDMDAQLHGTVNEKTMAVEIHDSRQSGGRDLLEHAAVRTLRSGGRVYGVPRDEMPGGTAVGAILRPGAADALPAGSEVQSGG